MKKMENTEDGNNFTISYDNLFKCPICKGKLETYSTMGFSYIESCYCPRCNIVRTHMMSYPVLCTKCYSACYYEKDGKHICWYCGNEEFKGYSVKVAEQEGLFEKEGYKASKRSVKSSDTCNHNHWKEELYLKNIYKYTCLHCFKTVYVLIPEK